MNEYLRKFIMLRSKLKIGQIKVKTQEIKKYISSNVVRLNMDCKYSYFSKPDIRKESKPFWNACKPYFTNKHSRGDKSNMLVEKKNNS